jgi:hypothetical protein
MMKITRNGHEQESSAPLFTTDQRSSIGVDPQG